MSKKKTAKKQPVKEKPIRVPKIDDIIETYQPNSGDKWVKSLVLVDPDKEGYFEAKDIECSCKGYCIGYHLNDEDWRWPLNENWREECEETLRSIGFYSVNKAPSKSTGTAVFWEVQFKDEETSEWEVYDTTDSLCTDLVEIKRAFDKAITTDRKGKSCPENSKITNYRLVKVTQEVIQEVEFKNKGV